MKPFAEISYAYFIYFIIYYNEDPEDMIENQRLAKRLQLSDTQITSNLEYLSGKGYVELTYVPRGKRVFRFVQITVDGIDLVEHPEKFEATFPKQEVHHHYHGDYYNVKVGDNNTNVVIGKGVYQFGRVRRDCG